MAIFDRFRRRPHWEHADAEVRADAVRQLRAEDQDVLAQIVRGDADARVRRAAVRKLSDPVLLAAALEDSDEGVREDALDALQGIAMGNDEKAAEAAVGALSDARRLVLLARSAPTAAIRQRALGRITDARHLATLAKLSDDPSLRAEALRRVEDQALLLEIATKGEHKDTVVAAVDRIEPAAALESVATRARNRAASRRARARIDALRPGTAAPVAVAEAEEPEAEEPEVPQVQEAHEAAAPEIPAPSTIESETVVAAAAVAEEEPATADEEPEPGIEPHEPVEAEAEAEAEVAAEASVDASMDASVEAAPHPQEPETTPAEREAKEQERREKIARIEEVCTRLEQLGQGSELRLRDAEIGLRDLRAAQSGMSGLPAKLVQRIKACRTTLFAKLQELREADEWSRWANATVQEELCAKLEALVGRDDLDHVARELREADARWAEVRRAPRDQAEPLRQRYQTARVQVRAKLETYFAQKAQQEGESLKQKEELCVRAEALADSTEWLKASEELKALQARWKEIGPVPRRHSEALWKRFRAACDQFFTRRQEDLKRRKEEWSANLVKKEALCVRAEALAESTEWDSAAAEVRRLQADWKTVGPVRRNKSEQVWQRFRKACDTFFERYKKRDQLALAEKRAPWEALCQEMDALVPAEGAEAPATAPEGLAEAVLALQARARQSPPPPVQGEDDLTRRFRESRDRVVALHPESFRGTELDPEANRIKKEKLCAKVEGLSIPVEEQPESLSGETLARRLKEALAARTMGAEAEGPARRRAAAAEVEAAQAAWKRLGPVPGEVGAALEERFRRACSRVLQALRPPSPRPPRPSGASLPR
jgi:hypothetical protein